MKRSTENSELRRKLDPWKLGAVLAFAGLVLILLHGMTAAQTGKAGAEPRGQTTRH